MKHFIIQCSCGNIMSQCKCPASNKTVTTVPYGCGNCHDVPVKVERRISNISEEYNVSNSYRLYDDSGKEIITNQKGLEGIERQINELLHGED